MYNMYLYAATITNIQIKKIKNEVSLHRNVLGIIAFVAIL